MVESDPHLLIEVITEEGDLGIPLAEVVQHDELGIHLHADPNCL